MQLLTLHMLCSRAHVSICHVRSCNFQLLGQAREPDLHGQDDMHTQHRCAVTCSAHFNPRNGIRWR